MRTLSFKEEQRLQAQRTEYFGFAGWLASTVFYALFLAWAYLPDETLERYGLTYYPAKHWALAVPAMIVVSYLTSLVIYKALNLLATPPLHSYATVLDVHSVFLSPQVAQDEGQDVTTPIMTDLSPLEITRALHK